MLDLDSAKETLLSELRSSLESYRDGEVNIINSLKFSNNFAYSDDMSIRELIKVYEFVVEFRVKFNEYTRKDFNIDLFTFIKDLFSEDTNAYNEKVSAIKEEERTKIDNLILEHSKEVKSQRELVEKLRAEYMSTIKPLDDACTSLQGYEKELKYIFRLYGLESIDNELETDLIANMEINDVIELVKSSEIIIKECLSKNILANFIPKLLYLPIEIDLGYPDLNRLFKIVYLIGMILACVWLRPWVVGFIGMGYIIHLIANYIKMNERQERLLLAHAVVNLEISPTDYLPPRPKELVKEEEYLEALINDDQLDLKKKIKEITKEKLAKAEEINPEPIFKDTYEFYEAYIESDEMYDLKFKLYNKLDSLFEETKKDYKDNLAKLYKTIDDINNPVLGDLIKSTDVLEYKFTLGYVNFQDKPREDYCIDFPLSNMMFLYNVENQIEVIDCCKLFLSNVICNVRTKRLRVRILDSEGLGKDFGEFYDKEIKEYLDIETREFDEVLKDMSDISMTNFSIVKETSVADYNKRSMEIGRQTLNFNLYIVYETNSGYFTNPKFQAFLKSSIKRGVVVWYIGPESYKEKEKNAQLDSFLQEQVISRGYDKLFDTEGNNIYVLPEDIDRYVYTRALGAKIVRAMLSHLASDKTTGIDYKKGFMEKYIPPEKIWSYDINNGIELNFGLQDGDPNRPYPVILKNPNVHGLMAGQTGAGKSVAINAFLLSLILKYPPELLELIMIDFKNVEFSFFKGKNNIPHASVIAGTTDGEYALSLFTYLYEEMKRRNVIFNKTGFKNIYTYNEHLKATGKGDQLMPILVLICDEFQVMFEEIPDKILEEIKKLIKLVAKLGRNAGCFMMFTSQSMDGTLSDDVKNQFNLRICLRCAEEVSSSILGSDIASKIDEIGWMYTNESLGKPGTSNRKWRIPYAPEEDISEIVQMLNKKCKEEGHLHRHSVFFDESEEFGKDVLQSYFEEDAEWYQADRILILGEKLSFVANDDAPVHLILDRDESNNISFLGFELEAMMRMGFTLIEGIKARNNSRLIISCPNKDIRTLMGLEDYVDDVFKPMIDPLQCNLRDLTDFIVNQINNRENHPEKEFDDLYIVGIEWDRMPRIKDSEGDDFAELIKIAPKYGIFTIMMSRTYEDMRSFASSFKHQLGTYAKEADATRFNEDLYLEKINTKIKGKYIYGSEVSSFKLYKFKAKGVLPKRHSELKRNKKVEV